jgi:predicted RNase H-like HicB family nuclease
MRRTVEVVASYDPEAAVWYVESSNVPGLSAEAATVEQLAEKLPDMIFDLLEENGFDDGECDSSCPIELIARQTLQTKRPIAA